MRPKRARLLGAIVQGLVLGTFLTFALIELINRIGGAAAFRYQGF